MSELLEQTTEYKIKHRRRKRWQRVVSVLASIVVFCTVYALILPAITMENSGSTLAESGGDDASGTENVTVTVNYVYAANDAMVAQPYLAQLARGAEFKKTLEVPQLFNYSIPENLASGLTDDIVLSKDGATGRFLLSFDLDSVVSDVTVTLYYKAGTAKYTVYHYYQNLENDEYTDEAPKIVELEGDIDAYTEATAESRHGYHSKGVPQTTIAADGTTKIEIYYDRNYYTVTFDVNGGVNGPEPIYAKYGSTFKAADISQPNREGYTFLGWDPLLADTVTIEDNATYTAVWQPVKGQADYSIVLWGQNANDDEYSYLESYEAWGNVGNPVTWNEGTLISHVHTDECPLICGKEAHTHTDDCISCGKEAHTHTDDCISCGKEAHTHTVECYNGATTTTGTPSGAPPNPQDGQIYQTFVWGSFRMKKYIYFKGDWYEYNGDLRSGAIAEMTCGKVEHTHDSSCIRCGKEEHTHDDSCIRCGKEEHTHVASCYDCGTPTDEKRMSDIAPDTALWKFEYSDTVTVNADGSTVLNVYFTRTEFTLRFREARSTSDDYGTITARWGADISAEYNAVVDKAGSSFWSEKSSGNSPYTNFIGVMPQRNIIYYNHTTSGNKSNTMTYYGQDLNGEYQVIFTISFKGDGYTVSAEDRYEFEGYTYDHGTAIGESCDGAEFYYNRTEYVLAFYSDNNNTPDRTHKVKYGESLYPYDYTPTNKPPTVESDALFVGWYLNPECTGEMFDPDSHTMPANNVALYAKWVNGLYTVRTWSDETMTALYTYDGYTGVQSEIEKYTLASEPVSPARDGYVFVGWFYYDGGVEKAFSFTMPITKDYDLYPKFSEPKAVDYTVHYYMLGTTDKVADDSVKTVIVGTPVTEKAKTGDDLNLVEAEMRGKYYPTNTSTSEIIIDRTDMEITFYYTKLEYVEYEVLYRDANGKELIPSETKTTDYSVVTEQYKQIDGYTPRQYRITQALSSVSSQNKIIFIYDPIYSGFAVQKQDGKTKQPLVGAEFILYLDAECTNVAAQPVTAEDGAVFEFGDLIANKNYYLKETKTPPGYYRQDIVWLVRIDAGGVVTVTALGDPANVADNVDGRFVIYNYTDYKLPETGGVGSVTVTLSGAALLLSTLICGYVRRRKWERRQRK